MAHRISALDTDNGNVYWSSVGWIVDVATVVGVTIDVEGASVDAAGNGSTADASEVDVAAEVEATGMETSLKCRTLRLLCAFACSMTHCW